MSQREAETLLKKKRDLEKDELLEAMQDLLEMPMVVLSFIMLLLFIVELIVDLSPDWRRTFNLIEWFIWIAFVIEYVVSLALSTDKLAFAKSNWLMTLAIVLPVLRVFRIFKAARAVRSLGTLRVITVGNRTISKLRILLDKRHLQYVLAVVAVVTVLGGAGIYFLEHNAPGANIITFGDAIWWSAGTVTTVGTEEYPVTAEGRVLAVIVMIFGVSIFGYIAGSLASMFIHIDQIDANEDQSIRGPNNENKIKELTDQIKQLEDRITELHRVKGGRQ